MCHFFIKKTNVLTKATRGADSTDSAYLKNMYFKRCDWISFSQMQLIINQRFYGEQSPLLAKMSLIFFFILMYSFVLFGWVRSVADKSIEKQLWLTCFIIDFTFSKTKKKIETLFIKLLMWWFIWLNLIFQTHSFTYTRNKTLSSFCCPMREIEKWCKINYVK